MAQKPSAGAHQQPAGKTISDDTILKVSKEIAVKFIEVGRLTPSTFEETFKSIYRTIETTVNNHD